MWNNITLILIQPFQKYDQRFYDLEIKCFFLFSKIGTKHDNGL